MILIFRLTFSFLNEKLWLARPPDLLSRQFYLKFIYFYCFCCCCCFSYYCFFFFWGDFTLLCIGVSVTESSSCLMFKNTLSIVCCKTSEDYCHKTIVKWKEINVSFWERSILRANWFYVHHKNLRECNLSKCLIKRM